MQGGNVTLNIFHPNADSYQPYAWSILRDLNINTVRLGGGIEGDLHHFNMVRWPNDWAASLNQFLSNAAKAGIRVFFNMLGTTWETLFGIVCPDPQAGIVGTPITTAKAMIDQLAGNNVLGHDFITDRRIFGWSTSNERNIGDPAILAWNLELCDYIRARGGKAWVAFPYDGTKPTWPEQTRFGTTEPKLRGHVDYLEFHHYGLGTARDAQERGLNVYDEVYKMMYSDVRSRFVAERGSTPIENLIWGEFGIWRGAATDFGFTYTFTDETRRDYYRAAFDAARELGVINLVFLVVFAQQRDAVLLTPNYASVAIDASYYPYVADVVKTAYAPPIPPIWATIVPIAGSLITSMILLWWCLRRG